MAKSLVPGTCATPSPPLPTPELAVPSHSYDLRPRASSPYVFGTFTPTNGANAPVSFPDDDAVLSVLPDPALVNAGHSPPAFCVDCISHSTTDVEDTSAPPAAHTPPHTAPVSFSDDDAVLSVLPDPALVNAGHSPPAFCVECISHSTTDVEDTSAPPAAHTPPRTAPVETKDSLDQGSVGTALAAGSSANAHDIVQRLRGGAESPEMELDYSQDTDTNCITTPGDVPFSSEPGNLNAPAPSLLHTILPRLAPAQANPPGLPVNSAAYLAISRASAIPGAVPSAAYLANFQGQVAAAGSTLMPPASARAVETVSVSADTEVCAPAVPVAPLLTVRCPYMCEKPGADGVPKQCKTTFASVDGVLPVDITAALQHTQGLRHLRVHPQPIWLPTSSFVSCTVPGCNRRMVSSNKGTHWMEKHVVKCMKEHQASKAGKEAADSQLDRLNSVPLPTPTISAENARFRAFQLSDFWDNLRNAPTSAQYGSPESFVSTVGVAAEYLPTGILDFVPSEVYRGPAAGWRFTTFAALGSRRRMIGYRPALDLGVTDSISADASTATDTPLSAPESESTPFSSVGDSAQSTPIFGLTSAPWTPPSRDGSENGDVPDPEFDLANPESQGAASDPPLDLSPAPSTPPSENLEPAASPAPVVPAPAAVGGAGLPGPGGDGPPDVFGAFDGFLWDEVICWRGSVYKHVPPKCRSRFRDLGNIVFLEATTGQIGAIKASVMFARAMLYVPLFGKSRMDSVVKSRLRRWENGEYASLFEDLAEYEAAFARREANFRSDEAEREKRVERKVAEGEISKALQAAMPSAPFSGPIDMVRALHPPKEPDEDDEEELPPLPENLPSPTVEPMEFYRAICETSRGTAQTASGWHSDLLKDINVAPSEEDEDPLYGFRAFSTAFALGTLPVSQDVKSFLASSKLAALEKPGSDKPRPVGITGVFHRLGLSALIRQHREYLAAEFGLKGEFGTGIPGACQLLAWTFKLASEKHPLGVKMWADITNGFNCVRRKAIAKGLARMPPQLQWLRRSFEAFYAQDVQLFFARDGEMHVILSEIGSMQGDPASGIWFNAAVQLPYDVLRAEFGSEVTLAKYFDDLMAFIPPNEDGTMRACALDEPRTASFSDAYLDDAGRSPVAVPMARAIAMRWKFLVKKHCGLEIAHKWGVASDAQLLQQRHFGNPNTNGLPVVPGLVIGGTPVGDDAFVKAKLLELVHESVSTTFDAVSKLSKVQIQHILARGCCGTMRVQHLWQTVNPYRCSEAVSDVDDMTAFAIAGIFGTAVDAIPDLIWRQIHLPQRFGGCGYRKSKDVFVLSFLGGFAMAAYSPIYNISLVAPFLAADVEWPEESGLPSLGAVTSAWRSTESLVRVRALSKAAVAGVVRPPSDDPDLQDPDTWPQQLDDQEARFETRFKAQAVNGAAVSTPESSYESLTQEISDRAENERVASGDDEELWPQIRHRQFQNPHQHPSVLRLWSQQGGRKFQKLFSRHMDMLRFNSFTTDLVAACGLRSLALFRAKINSFAVAPLTILPNKPERRFANDAFQWYLNDRVQLLQPSAASMSEQSCNCHLRPRIGDSNGRHLRTCPKNNAFLRFHDHIRDLLMKMCLAAGLTVQREPTHLLPAEPGIRPGDLYVSDWTLEGVLQVNHAIDFTAPSVDGGWSILTPAEKSLRATRPGVAAQRREEFKRSHPGTAEAQEIRGDNLSMTERCRQQRIHFWPVAIEVDGAITPSFLRFFKNVCNAAKNLTGQNLSSFKHYWSKRIACEIHQFNAKLCLQRAASLRRSLRRLPATAESVMQFDQLQTDLPSSVSDRSEFRDRHRAISNASRARSLLRTRRRLG